MAKKPERAGSTGIIRFDVTKEHRIGGNGASYVVKNYKNAIEDPVFQQSIAMGNALGYWGHPRIKVLDNGKLTYKPILIPKEGTVVPTHLCTYAKMDGKYCEHTQDFFDNEQGKTIHSLWRGNAGGFSSRASTIGGYGGKFYPTKLNKMAGFDFVHDRSYRYNSFEGVVASESVGIPELSLELMEKLGIQDKYSHYVCNGGMCPRPEDLALEQAQFLQTMENEIALEEAYKTEIHEAYKRGFEENLENEKRDYREQIEEFQEKYKENRKNDRTRAHEIAIECVNRMPRKPHLDKEFYKMIAPSLVENGEDEAAIESVFHEIFNYFTGYTPADFSKPEEEFVNIGSSKTVQPISFRPSDRFLIPHK